MSLAHDAAREWQEIMNSDMGATWPCVVTNPDGMIRHFVCRRQDIGQQIDPGTEQVVSGRQVSVSICLLDLAEVGFDGICGVEKETEKPWEISMCNIRGTEETFKVSETAPDDGLPNMLIYLEPLK